MTECERFNRLKDRLLKSENNKQILEKYVAMIATFAVKNGITLADSQEVAAELVGEYGQSLLDKGQFEQIKKEYEILKQLEGRRAYP